jgi:hypothetical protein
MKCEMCGGPMVQQRDWQRFCCRACSDEHYQEERRQAVAYFRASGMKPELRKEQEVA